MPLSLHHIRSLWYQQDRTDDTDLDHWAKIVSGGFLSLFERCVFLFHRLSFGSELLNPSLVRGGEELNSSFLTEVVCVYYF